MSFCGDLRPGDLIQPNQSLIADVTLGLADTFDYSPDYYRYESGDVFLRKGMPCMFLGDRDTIESFLDRTVHLLVHGQIIEFDVEDIDFWFEKWI